MVDDILPGQLTVESAYQVTVAEECMLTQRAPSGTTRCDEFITSNASFVMLLLSPNLRPLQQDFGSERSSYSPRVVILAHLVISEATYLSSQQWENHRRNGGSHRETMGNHGEIIVNPIHRKPLESDRKTIGIHRRTIGKP